MYSIVITPPLFPLDYSSFQHQNLSTAWIALLCWVIHFPGHTEETWMLHGVAQRVFYLDRLSRRSIAHLPVHSHGSITSYMRVTNAAMNTWIATTAGMLPAKNRRHHVGCVIVISWQGQSAFGLLRSILWWRLKFILQLKCILDHHWRM